MTTEQQAGLEEQRDVLLRSLRDLDQERAAGEIGDDDYATLKDDYTVRTAAVLRAIEAQRSTPPNPSPGTGRRRPPGGASGARAGGGRARGGRAGGGRRAGGRRTGGGRVGGGQHGRAVRSPAVGGRARGRRADRLRSARGQAGTPPEAAAPRPEARGRAATTASSRTDSSRTGSPPEARRRRSLVVTLGVALAIAAVAGGSVAIFAGGRTGGQPLTGSVPGSSSDRVAEALSLETQGKAVDALKVYDDILGQDPGNVEALTYRGWLLKRAGLPDQALESLDRAVAADPTFPDAHFFRGMVLYQDKDDPAGAVTEFQAFLADNPPADYVAQVQQVLAQAEAAAAAKAAGAPAPAADPATPPAADPATPPA